MGNTRFIRTPTGIIRYDNNFTDEQLTKLQNIEYGAQVNTVLGVKGSNETKYRIGYIEITKDNIGLGLVNNTPDIEKNVNSAKKLTTGRDITIGNQTINFDGTKNIAYTLLEMGAVNRAGDTITGDLTVDGAATLKSTLGVTGATTLRDILNVAKATTLGSTLNVTGATTITGATTLKSTLGVTGAVTLNDILNVAKAVNLSDILTVNGVTTLKSTLGVTGAVTLSDILNVAKAVTLNDTLTVDGATTLDSTLNVSDAATLDSTLDVTGAVTLNDILNVAKAVTLSDILTVTGATTLKSTLGVTGATTLKSTLGVTGATTLKSTLGVTGAATLGSTLNVAGAVTLNDILKVIKAVTLSDTLTVDGAVTLNDILKVIKAVTLSDTLTVNGATSLKSTLGVAGAAALGSTLDVTGAVTLNDILKVIKAVTLSDILTVDGATTLKSTLGVAGATALNYTLSVKESTSLLSTLDVTGATTLKSTLNVAGATTLKSTLNVARDTTLSSTLTVTGATTLKSNLTVNGLTSLNNTLTGTTIVATTGFTGELTGNSSTATKLKTARSINGTSFDGSSNITTTKWGTTRTITIGITSKNFDGGSNIGWSLAEIGALPLTGGTMTGDIGIPISKSSIDGSVPYAGSSGSITAATGMNAYKTYLGSVTISSVWYNMISIRHRNGNGDGSNYGMVLYSALTSSGSLAWDKQTGSNSWQGERIILDSSNYTSYTVTKTGSGASGTWGISVSGSAGSVAWENVVRKPDSYNPSNHTHNYAGSTSAGGPANSLAGFTNTTNSATAVDNATQNGHVYVTGTSGIFSQNDGAAFVQAYSTSWVAQIYQDYRTGQIALRGRNNGTWQAWRKVLDSSNYTSYTVTKTGSGASGTWGINVSGNAATATKLATARTITLSGSVTGSASFDGSGNITISTSTNHSHNYLPLSGGTMTGNIAFSAVTSTSYPAKSNKITWSGSTDGAEIYYQVDASDAGRLVLNLTDDTDTRICFALNGSVKSYIDANGNFSANAATASKLATARTITLSGSVTGSGTFDGSGNLSISTTTNHTHNYAGSSSAGGAATTALACTGNAATATKLATARTITLSGSVTGSASFDGSGNITISTSANHSHSYLPLSGGTMSGNIQMGSNAIYVNGSTSYGIKYGSKTISSNTITGLILGDITTSGNRLNIMIAGNVYTNGILNVVSDTILDGNTTIGGKMTVYANASIFSDLNLGASGSIASNNTKAVTGGVVYNYLADNYLPLTGGTLTGAVTCNSAITFGNDDNYGIRTAANNYVNIGADDKRFYRSYINHMYGAYIHLSSNASTTNISYNGELICAKLTSSRTYYLPDESGTIALTNHTHSYLPLTGGTLTGAVTCNSAITFGNDDNYGIRTNANHKVNIGADNKRFSKSYINYMYGASIYLTSNGSITSTSYNGRLYCSTLTTSRNYYLPDKDGIIAMINDLNNYLPLSGGALTGAVTCNSTITFDGYTSGIRTSQNGYGYIGESDKRFSRLYTNYIYCDHISFSSDNGTNDSYTGSIICNTLTANRSYYLPDKSGNIAMTSDISDRRLKNYIKDTGYDESIGLLKTIPVRQFTYKSDPDIIRNGLFAQDVLKYMNDNNIGYRPYLVINPKEGEHKEIYDTTINEDDVIYSLSYLNFIPDLWNGWRYHDEIIEKQQKEIDYLKSVIKDLINK